jgi:hypothetical protein
VDLRANCNKINIRTCSDSLAALAELINYLSNSGDLSGGSQQNAPSAGSHRVRCVPVLLHCVQFQCSILHC